jgi:hypothetical protein
VSSVQRLCQVAPFCTLGNIILGGADDVLSLDRDLLLEPHGGYVLLAAPVRHRPPRPTSLVPLVVLRDITL